MTGQRSRAKARAMPLSTPRKAMLALMGLMIAALCAQSALAQDQDKDQVIRSHGYSYYGDLTYPADYEHFDYVNPDAPKGGEISLYAPGTFDSMNPYSRKGRAGRLSWMVYESLLGEMPASGGPAPADVYGEMYGLLAESLEYDEGKTWVIFNMRPEARFADGTPVTAHDVVFSHNLFLEQGLPSYAQAVSRRITGAEALDDHRVKFTFAEGISRRSLIDQVGSTPVFPKAWYDENEARLDEPRLEAAPGSGPYQVASYDVNRRVVYERNPDYWGKDLPINRGRHNFDRIRIEYFADDSAAFEAFKAGEYTFRAETNSKTWATGYQFPAVDKGWVRLEELPDGTPPTPNGIVFNLAREPLKDKRVREAVALAFNFEWTNESLQYGLFKQRHSFVQDTPLQAEGVPEGAELELLKSLGDVVPEAMLSEPARRAHESDGSRLNDRRNLRRAMKLLDEAGWSVGDDGMRRNAQGDLLSLDFPIPSSGSATLSAVVESFVSNLKLMGIDARQEKVDPSQYTLRSRDRDYDLVFDSYTSFLGAGTGLMQRFGSQEAAFSLFNPAGLASPMVDAIIDAALDAETREEERTALTALDRALRHEFFMVPVWYNDSNWVAYWDMYEHPDTLPPYALGVLDFWWYNEDKAKALKEAGAL
ncbi:microcin C transport system substrate-binding protein [Roseovarius halotolerans]|uniref:Periplasmic oligopeptide-binding protein n=1 Tax=Roseovarius halotolerans TaxID=505353 RepID=A0A1X6ZQ83_9RHOB|nr:extracellular solute-binding protein [Roseovarius halotolerans]RKT28025.1 microcin C transport system substrate-binding protein [Roseovarius halotolerans]SLN58337.1 Periplasmic oligopeptide-binding protein precursor [Roseovarius halotolerans]